MPVQRLTWRDGGREDTFINKTQIITKYCNIGQNACTAQYLRKKNIKDSLLSKPYRRLWSPNFGHSMLYQLRLLFVLFRIKGVVQSVQGSETCIVDTSLLTMMW